MKKYYLFLALLFFSQILLSTYQEKPIFDVSISSSHNQSTEDFEPLEGIAEGVLIKAQFDYVPVEHLRVGDIIVGIDGEQEIVAIKKLIRPDGMYYGLTTEHHGFYIYPDEFVHNMDVACISSAGTLCFGVMELCNPVTLLVGALIPLSIYVVDYYRNKQQLAQGVTIQQALGDTESVKQARIYYQAKRQELANIHQDLLQLKNSLGIFLKTNYKNKEIFSTSLLSTYLYNPYKISLLPDIFKEIHYSVYEKQALLIAREKELEALQEEIVDIEVVLGFHINELVEQCQDVYHEIDEHMKVVYEYVSLWNQHQPWYDLVIKSYEASFLQEALSHALEQKIQEIEFVAAYYHKISNTIVRQTSNIYQVLQGQSAVNNTRLQQLAEWNKYFLNWRQVDEDYLSDRGALTFKLIDHLRNKAQQRIMHQQNSALLQAKKKKQSMKDYQQELLNKQVVVVNAGGAPDPDDEEWKKKHPHGRYEENPKHHQNSRGNIGKPPRDGQAALDNSIATEGTQRVAIQDGKVVILQQTRPGLYHGYIVEPWNKVEPNIRNALCRAGLVKNIKSGRF